MARPLLAWLAILGASGCALSLNRPSSSRSRTEVPRCDNSKGLVVVDGLAATASVLTSLAAFANDEPEVGTVMGLLGVAFVASAIRGSNAVDECREAQNQFTALLAVPPPADPEPVALPKVVRPTPPALPPRAPADPYTAPPPAPEPPPAPDDEWSAFWMEVP